eukprot:CAMPEP_0185553676 /NCGR_PEP_ID=MMETSP1381-20130426/38737_1 /TAXON_ID=298111 /ORGANISM="Pavlova sp., Strain CCMP459" /LENGTH=38 /DNA_ID= /DNA_START= /DNA_END= /DNA_ORIENTATION=
MAVAAKTPVATATGMAAMMPHMALHTTVCPGPSALRML